MDIISVKLWASASVHQLKNWPAQIDLPPPRKRVQFHVRLEIKRGGIKWSESFTQRSRLWLNDGSCIRLRPEHKNHVRSYDFMVGQSA